MYERVAELVAALKAIELDYRTLVKELTGPCEIELVAQAQPNVKEKRRGIVAVTYVQEMPETAVSGMLYVVTNQPGLYRAVSAYPAVMAEVHDYWTIFKTSAIIRPQLVTDLGLRYLGLSISGPTQVTEAPGAVVKFRAVNHWGASDGSLVEIPVEAGYQKFSGPPVSESGDLLVPILDTNDLVIAMNVAVQVGTTGLRWASHRVVVRKNSERQVRSFSVFGPNEVAENGKQAFIAAIEWWSGATETVVPEWSLGSAVSYASIDRSGVLKVGSLQVTTAVSVVAHVQVGDETYRADTTVVLKKSGEAQSLWPRWGVLTRDGGIPTQAEFESLFQATDARGVAFNFKTTAWVNQRTYVIVPAVLGVPTMLSPDDAATGSGAQWTTAALAQYQIDGQSVPFMVLYTVFDNLGNRNWQAIP